MSRFQNNNTFWKQWIEDLKYDLQVIPGKLDALCKKYSAPLIAMDHLHPMTDIKRTLSDYLYAFKASGNPNRWDPSNQSSYYDLREQLEGDNDYHDSCTASRRQPHSGSTMSSAWQSAARSRPTLHTLGRIR